MLDIYIKKAIIHSFDPGNLTIDFSSDLLEISPLVLEYISKKIEKVYSDEAKRGKFTEDNDFLLKIGDDFLQSTIDIANFWREEYSLAENQKMNDLLFVEFEKDTKRHFAFLRLSLRESFSHNVDGDNIKIRKTEANLPGSGTAADEAIIINLDDKTYHLIEKRIKYNGKLYNYFSENLLAESPDISINKAIKSIKKTAQSVAKNFEKDDFIFQGQVQNAIYSAIEENQTLNPEDLADQLFADNLTARLDFKEEIKENIPEKVEFSEIPTEKIEKKLSNQKLSLSNGIELLVPQNLYDDAETVEFIQEDDGKYSILIKNIEEINNKW